MSRRSVTLKRDVGAVQLPKPNGYRKVMPGLATLPPLRMYLGPSFMQGMKMQSSWTEMQIGLERITSRMPVHDVEDDWYESPFRFNM
jgi:hypothetical protein